MSSAYPDLKDILILFEKKCFLCSIIKICRFECFLFIMATIYAVILTAKRLSFLLSEAGQIDYGIQENYYTGRPTAQFKKHRC